MDTHKTKDTYGSVAKVLHWGIAVLVIGMLIVGEFMEDFPKDLKHFTYTLHKSLGITILALMLIRLAWRFISPKPLLPASVGRVERFLANSSYTLFYVLLIAMPLSGWIMSTAAGKAPKFYWLITTPLPFIEKNKPIAHFFKETHEVLAWTIIALLCLHVAGALKHHFWDRDEVLRRMV